MHHGHGPPGGGGDHVDFGIDLAQRLFQHHHGKDRRARRYVARALGHAVGGGHAGARVAFRRAQRRVRFQRARGVQQPRARLGQAPRVLAGAQHLGQNIAQLPRIALRRDLRVKRREHPRVIVAGLAVDGEHARRVAHAQRLHARQLPVHIARQRGQEGDALHVLLAVQNGLIQVRDAPALGNVEGKQRRQLLRGLGGHGVAPGAEGGQLVARRVKGQVAVHHGRDAHGFQAREGLAEGFLRVAGQVRVCVLNARPYIVQMIGPYPVLQTVFPVVRAHGHGRVIRSDQHRLDARGAQLNAQRAASLADPRGLLLLLHILFPP